MRYMTIGLAGLLFLSLSSSAIADDAEKTLKSFGAFVVGGEWEFKSAAGENVALKYSWFGKEKFLRLSGTRDGKATDKIVVIGVDPKTKKVTIWDFSVQGVIVPTMTQKEDGIWNVEAAFTGNNGQNITWKGKYVRVGKDELHLESIEFNVGDKKGVLPPTSVWKRNRS